MSDRTLWIIGVVFLVVNTLCAFANFGIYMLWGFGVNLGVGVFNSVVSVFLGYGVVEMYRWAK